VTRSRVLSSRLRERVIVTTKTGHAFAGVLFCIDKSALVLREAQAIGAGENQTDLPLDGEQIVLLDNVDYLQRL
jgi:small nuclear ribonucleoprotein (snRNP)-like protein